MPMGKYGCSYDALKLFDDMPLSNAFSWNAIPSTLTKSGRAGCFVEAKNLIEAIPLQPDSVVWGSLLAACKVRGNIKPKALMYAELRRWKDVENAAMG
ncbi:hypothetical protein K1719_014665 [Acacia pycnantha]|nr:hypothetical protein K1719_014665 [Acacia pycnantha]